MMPMSEITTIATNPMTNACDKNRLFIFIINYLFIGDKGVKGSYRFARLSDRELKPIVRLMSTLTIFDTIGF